MKKYIPEAEILSNVGAEQSFRLPFQASSNFVNLFNELDRHKEDLCIAEYGVSVTTLEEVFIRVGRDVADVQDRASLVGLSDKIQRDRKASNDNNAGPGEQYKDQENSKLNEMSKIDYGTLETDSFIVTFIKHFQTMFLKRYINGRRDKRMVLCQLVLPVALVVLGLGLLLLRPSFDQPELTLTPDNFNPTFSDIEKNYVPFNSLGSEFGEKIQARFNGDTDNGVFGISVPISGYSDAFANCSNGPSVLSNISNFLIKNDKPRSEHGSSRYGAYTIAAESNATDLSYNIMVNGSSVHGVGIFMNLMHSALLQVLTNKDGATITVRNHPLPRTWSQDNNIATADAFTAALFIMIAFCFVPASYATFVVKEREVKAKHQQIISGVNIYSYWCATWAWDLVSYLPTVGVVMIVCVAYDIQSFVKNDGGSVCFLLFLLFGPAVASFTYMLTFLFKSHSTAQLLIMFINFLTGLCLMVVSFVLTLIPSTAGLNMSLRYMYRLFPSFCLGDGLTQLALCDQVFIDFLDFSCCLSKINM